MSKLAVLIVEDEFLVALQTERTVSELGCAIVGPAAQLSDALALIESAEIDAALLDVNLRRGEKVYPAADELRRRAIPFAFLTAYGSSGVDPAYSAELVIGKPFTEAAVQCFLDSVRSAG